ncbi:MAG: Sua5 family C-terminal domain-containing protein, partial [Burkholderiaceae bacterium]
ACPVGIESTIIDLSGDSPRLLRHGSVTRAMLEAALGQPVPDAGADAPRASGRLKSHYAPRTPVELIAASELPARINQLRGTRLAVLAPAALLDAPAHVVKRLLAAAKADDYGRQLYAHLHELDAAGAELILITRSPDTPAWAAVNDRLDRAAAR